MPLVFLRYCAKICLSVGIYTREHIKKTCVFKVYNIYIHVAERIVLNFFFGVEPYPPPAMASLDSSSSSNDHPTMTSRIQHLTDEQHVRQCPHMYLGCDPEVTQGSFFAPVAADGRLKMVHHTLAVCMGLFKCYDELLVNAGDYSDPKSRVDVRFSDSGTLIVQNSRGIPVHLMEDGQTWNITGAFGMMRTGSNFDDSQGRTVGGLNGVGAKLCNILGTRFEVLTKDPNTSSSSSKSGTTT